jgi:hypothetical protein
VFFPRGLVSYDHSSDGATDWPHHHHDNQVGRVVGKGEVEVAVDVDVRFYTALFDL